MHCTESVYQALQSVDAVWGGGAGLLLYGEQRHPAHHGLRWLARQPRNEPVIERAVYKFSVRCRCIKGRRRTGLENRAAHQNAIRRMLHALLWGATRWRARCRRRAQQGHAARPAHAARLARYVLLSAQGGPTAAFRIGKELALQSDVQG